MNRFLVLCLLLATGCVLDPARNRRPARLLLGANARHFTAPGRSEVAFRDTTPKEMLTSHRAGAGTANFTLGMRHGAYVGGELEAGMLDSSGSSTAGAYGIFGLDRAFSSGTLGAELATGWRSVRYSTESDDISTMVIEPRLRASVWLAEQTSLSVTGGMTLDRDPVFVAGVSIGIHSNPFGSFQNSN